MVACDIETTGLQPYGPNADKIRLVQFGDENHGWAIPFDAGDASRNAIQNALTVFAGRLVGWNSRFDEAFLKQVGFDTGPQWDDGYILHHLSFPLDYHGLKSVAGKFYGQAARAGEKWLDQVKRKTHTDWATVPVEHPAYWGYAALDCCLTVRIWNDMASGAGTPQYVRELRVARLMAEVSERGMPVDLAYASGLVEKWEVEAKNIAARLADFQIESPGSAAQVAAALSNDGWEPDVLTETGKPSVNRAVLEGLDHEIASLVLRWRRVTKWSKSYVQPMIESGGRLHCNISSLRAATGRMAIDSPPLQQLPRGPEVRSCLLADRDTELWAIDYTGQEARLLAAYVGDPDFTEEVLSGGDIHGNIARALHGEGHTKDQRAWCKNAFYAYCPTPDARVMMDDLSWKPAGELEIGDKIRGFDEHLRGEAGDHPRSRARRWVPASIESVERVVVPTVEIELETGVRLVTSLDHQWLVSTNHANTAAWVKAEDVQPGWTMRQYAVPAEPDNSFISGWLSGIIDGEGHLALANTTQFRLGITQNEGPTAQRIRRALSHFGMDWSEAYVDKVVQFNVKSPLPEMYEFFSIVRPERLIPKVPYGNGLFSALRHKIVAVRPAPAQEVVVTQTSSSTMVIEGYGGHNCYGAAQARLAETAHAAPGAFEKAVTKAYPAIAGFMREVITTGKARLEDEGMAWARTAGGRMVAVPKSRIYALTNYIMQGGGADLVKQALIRIDAAGLSNTVRLVIHDEVLVALPHGPEGAEQAEIIRRCMETTFRGVHFEAHATGPGASWGDVA